MFALFLFVLKIDDAKIEVFSAKFEEEFKFAAEGCVKLRSGFCQRLSLLVSYSAYEFQNTILIIYNLYEKMNICNLFAAKMVKQIIQV